MKKKFKKKILGLSLIALLVILPFCTNGAETVEAETVEGTEYTFYYFFLDVLGLDTFNESTTFPVVKQHSSAFLSKLPEGVTPADLETADRKWIDLSAGDDGWTKEKYWKISNSITQGSLDEGKVKVDETDETIWYFTHTKYWSSDVNGEMLETYTDPTQYDIEALKANTYISDTTDGANKLELAITNGNISGVIKRTYNDDWLNFVETSRNTTSSDGKHPTDGKIWVPGLLQIKFTVANATPVTHNVTVKYVEDGTNKQLKDDNNLGSFAEGADYSAICDDTIGEYNLVSEKNLSGIMGTSDVTLYCKYSKSDEPTYKVTVNYLDKNTKKPIKDPYTYPTSYKSGDKYTATCPETFSGSAYILDSYSGNLNGTISDKDVVINCLYVTEAVQTSDIPIYVVWTVGGAALVYSIYYFRKYYKEQNSI